MMLDKFFFNLKVYLNICKVILIINYYKVLL